MCCEKRYKIAQLLNSFEKTRRACAQKAQVSDDYSRSIERLSTAVFSKVHFIHSCDRRFYCIIDNNGDFCVIRFAAGFYDAAMIAVIKQ